jgi:prepilin-type N-terminal cleavage/methylation domain-containing protein
MSPKKKKGLTLLEIIIVVIVIAILAAFVFAGLSGSRSAANDAVRRNDVANLYTSIVGKHVLSGNPYPDKVSVIKEDQADEDLQPFIDQFLKTIPYDPNPSKAYLYAGNGIDISIAAILEDGTCFIKSTGANLFGTEDICSIYSEGGIGLVQHFMVLHGAMYIDLMWAIPDSLDELPDTDISSAIVCLETTSELDANNLPSDEEMITNGVVMAVVNNSYNQYRITLDNPDYYYYCKVYTYDNKEVDPGVPGSHPNNGGGGISPDYPPSAPSDYDPPPSSNPPNPGGGGGSGGYTSLGFRTDPIRNPDGTGSITLSWVPGNLSTHTIIRRFDNTPPNTHAPDSLTDGTGVYNERNDKDGQDVTDTHFYTDTGLLEDKIYCYSAWAYDERTDRYSNGFVLACAGVPPADPSNSSLMSTTTTFTLDWVRGSSAHSIVRRQIGTPPDSIDEGVQVMNSTANHFVDNDGGLLRDTVYCYSIWSYNANTSALSTNHISSCGTLSNLGAPTGVNASDIAFNSIVLNWTRGSSADRTIVRRAIGVAPGFAEGEQIYDDIGNAYIDVNLDDNTNYCYSLWSYDNETSSYSDQVSACFTTLEISDGVCGTANGGIYGTAPTANLCNKGTPSAVSTDPYTVLLMHFDGVNNGTTFVEQSGKPVLKYSSGTVTSTANKKFGVSSGYYNTNSYLYFSNSSDFDFSSTDATIDFWYYTNYPYQTSPMIMRVKDSYPDTGFYIWGTNDDMEVRVYNNGTTSYITRAGSLLGSWHHVAVVQSGSVVTLYVDGIAHSSTLASRLMNYNANLLIGGMSRGWYHRGYLDEIRISKGVARWTANFIPPTSPYYWWNWTCSGVGGGSPVNCGADRYQ